MDLPNEMMVGKQIVRASCCWNGRDREKKYLD